MYGHSIKQKIIYEEREPPSFLYHGTEEKNIIPILKYGLEKQRRQYVHLTNDYNIAYYSAIRKNKKITVLKIRSKAAWKDGFIFYQPEIGVWLADYIPSILLVLIIVVYNYARSWLTSRVFVLIFLDFFKKIVWGSIIDLRGQFCPLFEFIV